MAESKNNIVTHGLSGKLGDLIVFRQKGSKTIVAKAPKDFTGTPSEGQQNTRTKFQQAAIYGKSVMVDAEVKSAYKAVAKEGLSAYNVAIADFFNAPDIHEVDVTGYTGAPGSKIKITVTDDFKVTGVHIKIENGDGSLVEQGNAVQDAAGSPDWIYSATQSNASLSGDKITITAIDQPDNQTVKESSL